MRYVIKIGTSSLFNDEGTVKEDILRNIIIIIKQIFNKGNEAVLVVSGAVACGNYYWTNATFWK